MSIVDTEKALNTIRFVSADAVQVANSGHPGMPMGTAAMAYTLFMRHMQHNPANPQWSNRDRFVLSGGHGSMLLYSLLYLTGYDLSIEELKRFRQAGSRTPGHPEWGHTPGVETTTGPLGQGFANGVGMAIAEAHLAAVFNRPGHKVVDHYIYAIVTDGDLMEGITSEAASLAGTLRLGKLIYLYDDNGITIEGSTDLAFKEDVGARFEAYGWHVQRLNDGNDVAEIDLAVGRAKNDPRPSLVLCPTTIGYGLPTKAGTAGIHGSPAGWDELNAAKDNAGWPREPLFYCDEDVSAHFRKSLENGKIAEETWQADFDAYSREYPELAADFTRRSERRLPDGWEADLPVFPIDAKGMATRSASGKALNALAKVIPELVGGSADLAPSNNTWLDGIAAFDVDHPEGRNIHFGVREMGMSAIVNGMFVHGGIKPFGATFLVFSDYARGALRLSALSKMGSVWVYTHDSIGVGEDGPTHQPIEQLMSLRLMPNMVAIRPGDANEVMEAWKVAVKENDHPTALILSRQNMPTLDRAKFGPAAGLRQGAYVLYDTKDTQPNVILMASGSELHLATAAIAPLEQAGYSVRVVSFPCWELFERQPQEYRDSVLPPRVSRRISIEAGVTLGWQKWLGGSGLAIGIDEYGMSAPGDEAMAHFGFTPEIVVQKVLDYLGE